MILYALFVIKYIINLTLRAMPLINHKIIKAVFLSAKIIQFHIAETQYMQMKLINAEVVTDITMWILVYQVKGD